jgi:hypothetical protein
MSKDSDKSQNLLLTVVARYEAEIDRCEWVNMFTSRINHRNHTHIPVRFTINISSLFCRGGCLWRC